MSEYEVVETTMQGIHPKEPVQDGNMFRKHVGGLRDQF